MQMNAPPLEQENVGVAEHRGVLILVIGIFSVVCSCLVLGIIAWVMGHADVKEMNAGRMDPAGRGLTMAGMVLGIVCVVMHILALVVQIILLAMGGGWLVPVGGP
jgi:uncharacterized membrane protein